MKAAAVSNRGFTGQRAGWRRGSFLVLVVGTLALLAVVMLVYVSVGNQDTRTRAALSQRDRLDDVPAQVRDYLSEQIIGADRLSTWYDDKNVASARADLPPTLNQEPLLLRELTDYGFTKYNVRSDSLQYGTVFTPTGSYFRPPASRQAGADAYDITPRVTFAGGYLNSLPQTWVPSDPWLAATEPTFLGYNLTGMPQDYLYNTDLHSFQNGLLKRDWLHISNVSPDGRFVNLYNLAPAVGGRRVPNYEALPGLGAVGGLPRLSEGLSLLSPDQPNNPQSDLYSNDTVTDYGVSVAGDRRHFPAYFSSRQRGAFRPARDLRIGAGYGPGTPNYLNYQWADADGDGMFDARWQELTDARVDPTNPLSFLQTDGNYRYFIAARIIDASGLVNVNTAADFTAAPTTRPIAYPPPPVPANWRDPYRPVGLTPADIDLWRLLTARDTYEPYFTRQPAYPQAQIDARRSAGYDGIPNPRADLVAAEGLREDNYAGTNPPAGGAVWPPSSASGYDGFRSLSTGHNAYTALRLSLAAGIYIPRTDAVDPLIAFRGQEMILGFAASKFAEYNNLAQFNQLNPDPNDRAARRLWDFVPFPSAADSIIPPAWPAPDPATGRVFPHPTRLNAAGIFTPPLLTHFPAQTANGAVSPNFFDPVRGHIIPPTLADRRAQFYVAQAAFDFNTSARVFLPTGDISSDPFNQPETIYRSSASFGMDDLAELITYRATNNPDVTSELERVLDGRDTVRAAGDPTNPSINPQPWKFGPVRSNRRLDVEAARDVRLNTAAATPGSDGQTDLEASLHLDVDIRQRLTTVSGSAPLLLTTNVDPDRMDDRAEVKIDARRRLGEYAAFGAGSLTRQSAISQIFKGYADALLPLSDIGGNANPAWNRNTPQFHNTRTLFYGYQGPELALHTAAHLTLNMADSFDRDALNPRLAASENANSPVAFTLLVLQDANPNPNNPGNQLLRNDGSLPWDQQRFPWWHDNQRLDLNAVSTTPRLAAPAAQATLAAPAVTMFGVEAQPFLVSAGTFTVYADMPTARGPRNAGDITSNNGDGDEGLGRFATMRRDVSRANPDLMFRVVAFQITNPFDVPVRLGNRVGILDDQAQKPATFDEWDVADANFPALDREDDFYYVKFGGRIFKLSQLVERIKGEQGGGTPTEPYEQVLSNPTGGLDTTLADIIIQPRTTIVCYALSQAPRVIAHHRMRQADLDVFGANPTSIQVRQGMHRAIIRQLNSDSLSGSNEGQIRDEHCFWIPEIDPNTGRVAVRTDDSTDHAAGLYTEISADRFAFGPLMPKVVDPASGQTTPSPELPVESLAGIDPYAENKVVELWRARRVGDRNAVVGTQPNIAKEYQRQNTPVPASPWFVDASNSSNAQLLVRNNYANDLLADRLRFPLLLPTHVTSGERVVNLDARLYIPVGQAETSNIEVTGAVTDPGEVPNYVGETLTLTTWAVVRRPVDPSVAEYDLNADDPVGAAVPLGALPVYCLERKDRGSLTDARPGFITRDSWNRYEINNPLSTQGINYSNIDINDFDPGKRGAAVNVRTWFTRATGTNRDHLSLTFRHAPTEVIDNNPGNVPPDQRLGTGRRGTIKGINAEGAGSPDYTNNNGLNDDFNDDFQVFSARRLPYESLYPEVILENNRYTRSSGSETWSTLRIGDMLLPLGVGPVHAPVTALNQPNRLPNEPASPVLAQRSSDVAWTTFGESMTAALGYDLLPRPASDPAGLRTPEAIGAAQFRFGLTLPPGAREYRLPFDRGNLVLDEFSPFFDANGAPNQPAFYVGQEQGGTDRRRWTQIPMALNILDQFSVGIAGEQSITRTVPGLINVNTASLAVARTLPMLSPMVSAGPSRAWRVTLADYSQPFTLTLAGLPAPRNGSFTTAAIPAYSPADALRFALESLPTIGSGNVWVSPGSNTGNAAVDSDYVVSFVGELSTTVAGNLTASNATVTAIPVSGGGINPAGPVWWGSGTQHGTGADIAAAMVAYRDKLPTPVRAASWFQNVLNPDVPGSNPWVTMLDYPDLIPLSLPRRNPDLPVERMLGRQTFSQIRAINEQPGIYSLGALMTVRHHGLTGLAPDIYRYAYPVNMDYLAYSPNPSVMGARIYGPANEAQRVDIRAENSSMLGVDSVPYRVTNPLGANPAAIQVTDTLENEFKEKLGVLNGFVNTVTTRSDYFIAWFVIHGYQRSDLENLGLNDPLVPSIARRFVMVVDRSNVVKRGDKPRILLFRELPYSPN
jgi:hypothetical protein